MNPFIRNTLKRIEKGEKVTIWFDIDGTLCDSRYKNYADAIPDEAMISLLNYLYDKGCQIFLVTARGSTSGIDWRKLTEKELKEWGVKYHKLIMGYPKDLYIGDETLRPNEFLELI